MAEYSHAATARQRTGMAPSVPFWGPAPLRQEGSRPAKSVDSRECRPLDPAQVPGWVAADPGKELLSLAPNPPAIWPPSESPTG